MANADKPRGFRFGYTKHGGPPLITHTTHGDLSTTAIYEGDPVYISAGKLVAATDGTDVPYGVAAAYSNASAGSIPVYNDLRNTVFVAQVDDATVLGASLCGPNIYYDMLYTAGTTASEQSTKEIDGDASDHDSVLIIDKVSRPDNAWGANVDVYCQIRLDVLEYVHDAVAS